VSCVSSSLALGLGLLFDAYDESFFSVRSATNYTRAMIDTLKLSVPHFALELFFKKFGLRRSWDGILVSCFLAYILFFFSATLAFSNPSFAMHQKFCHDDDGKGLQNEKRLLD
jgi:membrane-anchored glycerophosphoryl diester phosphodiesterase (GDPDase)